MSLLNWPNWSGIANDGLSNIPFEVYLQNIGRPRGPPVGYPQHNVVVHPHSPRVRPYNIMFVPNSMAISPYPIPTFQVREETGLETMGTFEVYHDMIGRPGYHSTQANLSERPIPLEPNPSIRENTEETGLVDTKTAAAPAPTTPKTTNLKKYKCQFCRRGFSRTNTLVAHERIHKGVKPFPCKECDSSFRQHGNLTRHVNERHRDKKTFSCDICQHAFNRKANLKTHLNVHRLRKPP